jgi:predicted Zn-dependent protease
MDLRAHGYTDAAAETMQRAIASYRSRPALERKSQLWREWFADALYAAGDFAAADTAFRSLMREFPTTSGYPDNAYYVGRIGALAARRGDSATAKAMSHQLKKTDRFQAGPGQESRLYRAKIAALLGDHAEAMRLLTSAYGAFGTTELHEDMDFEGMKSYPAFQEFVRPKG